MIIPYLYINRSGQVRHKLRQRRTFQNMGAAAQVKNPRDCDFPVPFEFLGYYFEEEAYSRFFVLSMINNF